MAVFNLPTGYDTSQVGVGSGLPDAGKCHALVVGTLEREKDIEIQCSVLAHEKPNNVNKKFRFWLQKNAKDPNNTDSVRAVLDRALYFVFATGTMTRDDVARQQAQGNNIVIKFEDARSRTFMTVLEESTNPTTGKKYVNVGFTFINPYSPESEGYPRDPDFGKLDAKTSEDDSIPF